MFSEIALLMNLQYFFLFFNSILFKLPLFSTILTEEKSAAVALLCEKQTCFPRLHTRTYIYRYCFTLTVYILPIDMRKTERKREAQRERERKQGKKNNTLLQNSNDCRSYFDFFYVRLTVYTCIRINECVC